MSRHHPLRAWIAVTGTSLLLSACALSKDNTGTFVEVPEERGRIVIESAPYLDVQPLRVGFADIREREEYALYRTTKGQAEFLFAETRRENGRNIVLDFDKLVAATVRMWRFNHAHTLQFDDTVSVENGLGGIWMQTYRQTDIGRQCAGYFGNWDFRPDDPKLRPTKVLFGYHCAPKGTPFGRAEAELFVKSIDIRGISIPLRIKTAYDLKAGDPPLPPHDVQAGLMVQAQDGTAGGVAGLPDFPLLIGRMYRESDSPNYDK